MERQTEVRVAARTAETTKRPAEAAHGGTMMVKEPMSQNQKFALLVFAILIGLGVVLVYMNVGRT